MLEEKIPVQLEKSKRGETPEDPKTIENEKDITQKAVKLVFDKYFDEHGHFTGSCTD